jgi:hypothetical protein
VIATSVVIVFTLSLKEKSEHKKYIQAGTFGVFKWVLLEFSSGNFLVQAGIGK